MDAQPDVVALLSRAIDQTESLLADVSPDDYDKPSTCSDWTVGDLVQHVAASPRNFVDMFAGKDVDWTNPPSLGDDPAADFRSGADELLTQLRSQEGGGSPSAALPEFAVHAWDLAQSTGSSRPLDDEVAKHALAFMSNNLTPENRSGVFAPPVHIDDDRSVQDRLAAFAGRTPPD
ncbi:maleylpyruvate isomerase family mycothiol-dependent enzyme [Knoellia aerolata]|uniref:Mycothiol-dependent maleylpyruvate isomerase metal-binding domain-containing protein n=1 Tax=Knoellia aerolata DSM 18566 TaxID=1385519 RepID=A0A0A0JWH1_9MICO|nr:maleylpyruvate isomerase family mycothiol-dependent enzyme [Knoellia aerolata]KGN41795.1 hypothetical protein N801_04510 [Knoellia aerolata DSM 18566]